MKRGNDASQEKAWVWGFHSLEAALELHPELVLEIFVEKKSEGAAKILALCEDHGLTVKFGPMPRVFDDKRTQGVGARLKYFPTLMWKDYTDTLLEQIDEGPAQWVLLDEVQDPRNFGAILRSAAAFGVKGVFVSHRNQSPVTGVVAQTSAGTVFRIPIVVCNNLKHPLEYFMQKRIPALALEMEGQSVQSYLTLKKPSHILWVLGSEGEGLSERLRELCAGSLGIPMDNGVESLNVSAAGTVIFYIGKNYLSDCL